jgi:hypothetical protein
MARLNDVGLQISERIESKMDKRFATLDNKVTAMAERNERVITRLNTQDQRIHALEDQVTSAMAKIQQLATAAAESRVQTALDTFYAKLVADGAVIPPETQRQRQRQQQSAANSAKEVVPTTPVIVPNSGTITPVTSASPSARASAQKKTVQSKPNKPAVPVITTSNSFEPLASSSTTPLTSSSTTPLASSSNTRQRSPKSGGRRGRSTSADRPVVASSSSTPSASNTAKRSRAHTLDYFAAGGRNAFVLYQSDSDGSDGENRTATAEATPSPRRSTPQERPRKRVTGDDVTNLAPRQHV